MATQVDPQLRNGVAAILDEDGVPHRSPYSISDGAIDAIVKAVRGEGLDTLLPVLADELPGGVLSIARYATGYWCCTIHDTPVIAHGFGETPTAAIRDAQRDYAARDPEAAKRDRIARLRSELAELGAAA